MRLVSIAAIVLAALPSFADDATKRAKIEEMLQLTEVDKMTAQVMEQMKRMAAQNIRQTTGKDAEPAALETQNKVFALMQQQLSWEKMKPEYIALYSDVFSEDDVDAMLAFYKSPGGRSMLQKMPMVMQRSMQLSQKRMAEIMPEIQKIMGEAKVKQEPK